MAFYGKEFTLYKEENFDAFLRSSGVPEDKIAAMTQFKPTFKVTQSGDSYTLTSSTPAGPKASTFKSGVEFDDVLGEQKTPVKTTYTVDGNTITQVIKTDQGQAVFKREFNGNELVVIAAEVSAPLAKTDEIVLVGDGGASGDIARLAGNVTPALRTLTGLDLTQVLQRLHPTGHEDPSAKNVMKKEVPAF